jgi:FixJ family two-component response regulator
MPNGFLGQPGTNVIWNRWWRSTVTRDLIAIVDDDESVRRTTTLLITSFGFRAEAFESAESFLNSGYLNDVCCLITDVRMSGMDGLQLQSQLATANAKLPIIFITGHDDKEAHRQAMQAGAVAFLAKPFGDQQLVEAIRSALHESNKESGAARSLISVIDDDESVRGSTKLLIESFGFRSLTCDSANGFLDSGHLADTACLIVDVQMPGMNGLELQSQLAAADRRIPIIFITAYDDKESRRRAMQAGAVAFLAKPFSDKQLLETIHSALENQEGAT